MPTATASHKSCSTWGWRPAPRTARRSGPSADGIRLEDDEPPTAKGITTPRWRRCGRHRFPSAMTSWSSREPVPRYAAGRRRRGGRRSGSPADCVRRGSYRAHRARSFDKYVARIGRQPAPMGADYRVAVASSRVWVIEADGEVAGVVVNEVHDDHLLLDTVAVAPGAQGHGYGALLLTRARTTPANLGFRKSGSSPTRR